VIDNSKFLLELHVKHPNRLAVANAIASDVMS